MGRGRADSTSWQLSEEESEWRVFYVHRVSYPLTAIESTRSRPELPNWHYFVCNLLIIKGVGLRLACIVKGYICVAGSKALSSETGY